MKKTFTYIILLFFVCYVNSTSVLWIVYFSSQNIIATKYCVNKTIPCCKGKCHINKVDDNEASSQKPVKTENRFSELTSFVIHRGASIIVPHDIQPYFSFCSNYFPSDITPNIFQPPKA